MARRAFARRAAISIIHMTLGARDLRMFARQRKNPCMIESGHLTRSIMATQAGIAHLATMTRDKFCVSIFVAFDARRLHCHSIGFLILGRIGMAGTTGHCRAVVIALMGDKRKAELVVRNVRDGCAGQPSRASLMIGMAMCAIWRVTQLPVQIFAARNLIAHIRVTASA